MELESSLPCSQEQPLDPVLSQVNPVYVFRCCFLEMRLRIVLSTPGFREIFLSGFRSKFCIYFSSISCVLRVPFIAFLAFITLITLCRNYKL